MDFCRRGKTGKWRRERDSNPRWSCPHTRSPGVRLQPLGQPSKRPTDGARRDSSGALWGVQRGPTLSLESRGRTVRQLQKSARLPRGKRKLKRAWGRSNGGAMIGVRLRIEIKCPFWIWWTRLRGGYLAIGGAGRRRRSARIIEVLVHP